jgi:uncharacterized protein
MARIETNDDLRRVLGQPREATKAKLLDALDEQAVDFIKACPFALLATTSAEGRLEVSPKGDEPGFIRIEDAKTLLMPDRVGNNLAFGLENIIATGHVALICLRPGTGETLRVSGRAEIFDDAALLEALGTPARPALLAIRIHIERCYFHCARSVYRAKLWQSDAWPERQRVSFGKILAERTGGDHAAAKEVDDRVASAYTTRLWKND